MTTLSQTLKNELSSIKLTLKLEHGASTYGKSNAEVLEQAKSYNIGVSSQLTAAINEVEQPAPQPAPQPAQHGDIGAQLKSIIESLGINANAPQLDETRIIELIKEHTTPAPREVVVNNPKNDKKVNVGIVHECFDLALNMLALNQDLYFYGDTGTGKSTTARALANALDLEFHQMGALMTKYEALGAIHGKEGYMPSALYKWLKNPDGGLLCFDEIDSSIANALTAIMAIFDRQGSTIIFPNGEKLTRTKNHRIVLTGNTIGEGASAEFNGRLKLDKAFLSRFIRIEHDYSPQIEDAIGGKKVADYARKFRKILNDKRIKGAVITPRTIETTRAILDSGFDASMQKEMIKTTFKQGMKDKDYQSVVANLPALV